MLHEFVPDKSELKEQGVEGNYDEIQMDTYEEIALALNAAGADVDISGIDARRHRRPWWKRNYGAGYVSIGNQKYQVSEIRAAEVAAFYYDLIGLFGAYNVDVHTSPAEYQVLRLVYRYAWELFKWFRVVREKSDLTYAGAMTTGNGIVLDKILPKDLGKTDWTFTAVVGAQDYFGTAGTPVTIARSSGLAIFAHTDEVVLNNAVSPIDQVKVNKNGIDYPTRGFNFTMADSVEDNRGVFAFVPNDTVYIQINGTAATDSRYHPIGVILTPVEKAKQLNISRIS